MTAPKPGEELESWLDTATKLDDDVLVAMVLADVNRLASTGSTQMRVRADAWWAVYRSMAKYSRADLGVRPTMWPGVISVATPFGTVQLAREDALAEALRNWTK